MGKNTKEILKKKEAASLIGLSVTNQEPSCGEKVEMCCHGKVFWGIFVNGKNQHGATKNL